MPLGIVAGSEVNTPSSGAGPINGEAFRQAALAPGRLAQAIGQDVGGVFQDVTNKIQDARNAKAVFQADMAMRQTKDTFLADIQKNPQLASDPGTWVPEWQKRSQETQDNILNQPNLAPIVKRHLTQMSGIWNLDSTTEIRQQALHRENADTKEAGVATATAALNSGDPSQLPQAIAAYKSLNEIGLMGPKELAVRIKQAPVMMAEAQANNVINTSPETAPQVIKDQLGKTLPPKKLETILKVADQRQAFAQNQNAQDIKSSIYDDPTHTVDEKMLKAKKDAKKISAAQYDQIMVLSRRLRQDDTRALNKQETDEFQLAKSLADNPPTDGTTLDKWGADIKAMGLSWTNQTHTNLLNAYVNNRMDAVRKHGQAFENPMQADAVEQLRRESKAMILSRESLDRRSGKYVMPDEAITSEGGNPKDRVGFAESQKVIAAHQQEQMRQFFDNYGASHPGKRPTPEEISTERQRILAPDARQAVRNALLKGTKREPFESELEPAQ